MKRTYSLSAPDQARLKIARTEIEALLKKHDLGGLVVLHTPGMCEFFYDIQPSYSCAWIDERFGGLRVQSKRADYDGDLEAQRNDQAATAQLLRAFAEQTVRAAIMFTQVAEVADRLLQAEHSAGQLVPDPMEAKLQ